MHALPSLLAADEPAPVEITNPAGVSPHLILCDHAGRRIPRALEPFGVPPAEMDRHIAWDIGIEAVSLLLSAELDAVMIAQRYSRLVIDCNRAPGHPTSIPPVSDATLVPANANLGPAAIAARTEAIFDPYHAAIVAELNRREEAGRPSVVIAMHSFTPVFGGVVRPWPVGVLHDRDPAFSQIVMALFRAEGLLVGDNEPYRLDDSSDYTVPVHAERRGLPYLELEIRQDLIAAEPGQREWAARLAKVLPTAWASLIGLNSPTQSATKLG